MNVHLVVSANYLQFEGTQQAHYLLQKKKKKKKKKKK